VAPVSSRGPRVVALGGGHGLYASLSALRDLDVDITAIVTVADDGGSSGRLLRELGILPPGDLRMALSALATASVGEAEPLPWTDVLQHRMGGAGVLAGHPIGNLVLAGLMELRKDAAEALSDLAMLIGATGRVLPMSAEPLDLLARVESVDPDDPVRTRIIRGQSSIAATPARVTSIELVPFDAQAHPLALQSVAEADFVVLGPGSWYTSVIPHLLLTELGAALCRTNAAVIVVLNLEAQAGETDGFSPADHVEVLREYCPSLHIDYVIADTAAVLRPDELSDAARAAGGELVLAPVAAHDDAARHDATRLGSVFANVFGAHTARRHRLDADRPATADRNRQE